MYVKTKTNAGHKYFFLCIPESGGHSAETAKLMEHSLPLGRTLDLSAERWIEILRASSIFRRVPLKDVLKIVEAYVAQHGLDSQILDGLREAVHGAPGKRSGAGHRKEPEDEFAQALKLLGVTANASNRDIESAFRKSARRHHPDVGGDPAKFRALLAARDLLLGRETFSTRVSDVRRGYDSR